MKSRPVRYVLRDTDLDHYFHNYLRRKPKYYHHFDQPCINIIFALPLARDYMACKTMMRDGRSKEVNHIYLQVGVCERSSDTYDHGPLARYVKLWVAHSPGISGTFFPPPRISDPDMHHGTCVTHMPWCMPGSLTSSLFWSRWRGKRSRHSRRMRNSQFGISGKRSMI